jgi:hypothetical protein
VEGMVWTDVREVNEVFKTSDNGLHLPVDPQIPFFVADIGLG